MQKPLCIQLKIFNLLFPLSFFHLNSALLVIARRILIVCLTLISLVASLFFRSYFLSIYNGSLEFLIVISAGFISKLINILFLVDFLRMLNCPVILEVESRYIVYVLISYGLFKTLLYLFIKQLGNRMLKQLFPAYSLLRIINKHLG
jgi:hypothetical protein